MELTPEEKRKIYEEEKARIEAQEKVEREKQGAEGSTSTGLKPTTAALLCYVGIWVSGLILFLVEEKNKFVRFHAAQSIVTFGTLMVAGIILGLVPVVGGAFSTIIGVIGFIVWILMIVKASNGERYKLPWAGDIAEKMIATSADKHKKDFETEGKDEYSKPPTPAELTAPPVADVGKRIGDKVEDYFRNARSGRIASSTAAIAWSVVLLIFFTFFNQYIAYYQHETVDNVTQLIRYSLLTEDFNAVLPILTTTLALSIVGHIILLIFDKYLLREIILIVLNLFGIATVATFLSVFPFDFGVIPNTDITAILNVVVAAVLIVIIVGLGIGTLVRFIKLTVNIARKEVKY